MSVQASSTLVQVASDSGRLALNARIPSDGYAFLMMWTHCWVPALFQISRREG